MVPTPSSAAPASTTYADDDDDSATVAIDAAAASSTTASSVARSVDIGGSTRATTMTPAKDDDDDDDSPPPSPRLVREVRILDRLTSVYGFPYRLAMEAIEGCGSLPADDNYDDDVFVAACYNWILDNHDECDGAMDNGGPVIPKMDCPHVCDHAKFRIFDVGEDGTMSEIVIVNDDERGSTIVTQTSEGGVFPRPRPGDVRPHNLMNVECQYHRDDDRRRRMRERRRCMREHGEVKGGITPVVGRLKSDDADYDGADAYRGDGKDNNNTKHHTPCPKGMNWLCLECGVVMCSRYANGHAKTHYEITREEEEEEEAIVLAREDGGKEVRDAEGHCIAVCLADLSVWCYGCNAYLRHSKLDVLTRYLEGLKFGDIDAYIVMTNPNCPDERMSIGRDFTYSAIAPE
ncbi:hypothetical protein ACHAXA_005049 [Cyclostephanos tholiformis]|uniref:UBP-type domain-containing protein n=1 Tax=Cyclostephanos tholiformis TaxID=382380 RepID=A0ABD3SS83_9STRA